MNFKHMLLSTLHSNSVAYIQLVLPWLDDAVPTVRTIECKISNEQMLRRFVSAKLNVKLES